mmetsp:Transcript_34205/g.72881  ORF Transcript_34205/g.72881 Transcript_34205/m.72881 type:complete len:267 (-) Transcript_34205:656-1456(-)
MHWIASFSFTSSVQSSMPLPPPPCSTGVAEEPPTYGDLVPSQTSSPINRAQCSRSRLVIQRLIPPAIPRGKQVVETLIQSSFRPFRLALGFFDAALALLARPGSAIVICVRMILRVVLKPIHVSRRRIVAPPFPNSLFLLLRLVVPPRPRQEAHHEALALPDFPVVHVHLGHGDGRLVPRLASSHFGERFLLLGRNRSDFLLLLQLLPLCRGLLRPSLRRRALRLSTRGGLGRGLRLRLGLGGGGGRFRRRLLALADGGSGCPTGL